jgi:hypothetical protein
MTGTLFWLNLVWLIGIVFLPYPTELIGVVGTDDAWAPVVYIGTLAVTSLAGLAMHAVIARTPAIHAPRSGRAPRPRARPGDRRDPARGVRPGAGVPCRRDVVAAAARRRAPCHPRAFAMASSRRRLTAMVCADVQFRALESHISAQ